MSTVLSYTDMVNAGVSPRRLEWWTRKGYLRTARPRPGSGHAREWLPGEDEIGQAMVRLADAGLSPRAAHRAARGEPLATGIAVVIDGYPAPISEVDIKRAIQALICANFYGEVTELDEKTLAEMAQIAISVYREQHMP